MKQLYFIITDNCNLACKHCIRDERNYKGEMNKENAFEILEIFSKKYPKATCILSGGEPTLHSNFEEILSYSLKNFKGKVSINTNGTTNFFSEKKYLSMKSERIQYQISLDGNKEAHDFIRGNGKYDKAINTIKDLTRNGFKVNVSTTISQHNINSIFELADALKDLDINFWSIQKEMPFGIAKSNFNENITTNEWNIFCDELLNYVDENIKICMRKLYDVNLLEKLNDEDIEKFSLKAVKNCGTAKEKLYIHPDLTVFGCTCMEDLPIGNLKKVSLEEILQSNIYKSLCTCRLKNESPCKKCRYVKICNGGCAGMSKFIFGEIGYGDIRCPFVKKYYDERKNR